LEAIDVHKKCHRYHFCEQALRKMIESDDWSRLGCHAVSNGEGLQTLWRSVARLKVQERLRLLYPAMGTLPSTETSVAINRNGVISHKTWIFNTTLLC